MQFRYGSYSPDDEEVKLHMGILDEQKRENRRHLIVTIFAMILTSLITAGATLLASYIVWTQILSS